MIINISMIRGLMPKLRNNLDKVLSGPGITWNKKGILQAYDQAVSETMLQIIEEDNAGVGLRLLGR